MPSLVDHDTHTLAAELAAAGHHPVHARRALRHFYAAHGSPDWDAIPISRGVRRHVEQLPPRPTRIVHRHTAADGTTKLLLAMADGAAVEAVIMPGHRDGVAAACVSSQVGCAMGCDFCASTRRGLERDLTAGEIADQFVHLSAAAAEVGRKLKTLVFMGMGEPLANLAAVAGAVRRIADPDLGGLGWRQVTVSTVGLVPAIDRLASLDLNVNLAVSLHAPDDATRSALVPPNRRYPVAEVMAAARRFLATTGRTPTVEYCLLADVNDHDWQAEQLADLMAGFRGHVNLIPYNPTGPGPRGVRYRPPSPERVTRFLGLLRDRKVVAHVRETRGDDVNAACGQLRRTVPLMVRA
jgi:23S rRNA (adenine2503-C2)-methyltransferase